MDGSDLRTIVNSEDAGRASYLVVDYQGEILLQCLLLMTALLLYILLCGAYCYWVHILTPQIIIIYTKMSCILRGANAL